MRGSPRWSPESGLLLLPVAVLLSLALSATYLLLPSLDHEEFREVRRLHREQARAAAEGAVALAAAREESVAAVEIGRATARAEFREEDSVVVVRARATVPSYRGGQVGFEVEARLVRDADGTLEVVAWE